jgi:hypothetical protein
MKITLLLAVLFSLHLSQAQDTPAKAPDLAKETHDEVAWKWEKDPKWEDYAAKLDAKVFTVSFKQKENDYEGQFQLRRVADDKVIATWNGHAKSCFFLTGDKFVYAAYSPIAMGGTLHVLNVETGKELWKLSLPQSYPYAHSKWSNKMNIEERDGRIYAYSLQSGICRFVWVTRLRDGLALSQAFYHDIPR